jgi:hypothetical protein
LPFNAALCNKAATDGKAGALVQRASQVHVGQTWRAPHKLFDFVDQMIHAAMLATARRPASYPSD